MQAKIKVNKAVRLIGISVFALGLTALAFRLVAPGEEGATISGISNGAMAVPVEVDSIRIMDIEHRRTFSGALESREVFVVAPRISGHLAQLHVDISDRIHRDQIIAELDSGEYQQAVLQAEANLAVAMAGMHEARNALEISDRDVQRLQTLLERGVESASRMDIALSERLRRQAAVVVSEADVMRAEAALESARIRLGYTQIRATWNGGSETRVVGQRFASSGDTVGANSPLVSVVEMNPLKATIFVSERDYGSLAEGQTVTLSTDAFPGEVFTAMVERIAPVFQADSRQARVELRVDNPNERLKPGMFVRADVVIETAVDALVVPAQAITRRNDETGVFLVRECDMTVSWQPVLLGIRDRDLVQIIGEPLAGMVVTLGQQMLREGTPVIVPATLIQTGT
jgi:RND family efflux transporter MFP subunit